MDAYEFSFVAVPALREAGVLKGFGRNTVSLKELADENGAQEEYRQMFKLAQLGRKYEKQLQTEVVRLCLGIGLGLEEPVLRSIAQKMGSEELARLKEALELRLAEMMPVQSQLMASFDKAEAVESGFLI